MSEPSGLEAPLAGEPQPVHNNSLSASTPRLGGGGIRYGVAHIDYGQLSHLKFHGSSRDDALRDLADCQVDEADCFLVRQTVSDWEPTTHVT